MNDPIIPADVFAQVVQVRYALGWVAFLIAFQIVVGVAVCGACVVILRRVFRVLALVETHGGIGDRVVRSAASEVTAEVRRVGESIKAETAATAATVAASLAATLADATGSAKNGITIETPAVTINEHPPAAPLSDQTGEHTPV